MYRASGLSRIRLTPPPPTNHTPVHPLGARWRKKKSSSTVSGNTNRSTRTYGTGERRSSYARTHVGYTSNTTARTHDRTEYSNGEHVIVHRLPNGFKHRRRCIRNTLFVCLFAERCIPASALERVGDTWRHRNSYNACLLYSRLPTRAYTETNPLSPTIVPRAKSTRPSTEPGRDRRFTGARSFSRSFLGDGACSPSRFVRHRFRNYLVGRASRITGSRAIRRSRNNRTQQSNVLVFITSL